jgi:hypothetical protein
VVSVKEMGGGESGDASADDGDPQLLTARVSTGEGHSWCGGVEVSCNVLGMG